MAERTEDDLALGVIPLELDKRRVNLKTLPWDASDEWQALAQERLRATVGTEFRTPDELMGLVGKSMGAVLDLVVAYDRDHVLGSGVEDLKRRFDKAQVYEIFKAIARHEFPFVTDATAIVEAAMPMLRPILYDALAGLASRQLESSNGSPAVTADGDSTPGSSEPTSIGAKSDISGKLARSA